MHLDGRRLSKTRRRVLHALFLVGSLAVAITCVQAINRSYWETEPYGGEGQPARELAEERPWLAAGIHDLIRIYSIPLSLIVFTSLYGACFALLEMKTWIKYLIAANFIYVLPGYLLGIFFYALIFVGIISAVLLIKISVKKQIRSAIWLSSFALAHTIVSGMTAVELLSSWLGLFGD